MNRGRIPRFVRRAPASRTWPVVAIAATLTALTLAAAPSVPAAVPDAPPASQAGTAAIVKATAVTDRLVLLSVASPAMGREVPVYVLTPADPGAARGVLYLLDGNSGTPERTNWLDPAKGNAQGFYADKNVNVVMPVGGTGSLYQDWQQDNPKFGRVRWETFLAEELPPLVDDHFRTNGRNVIGGISSGAQGALMLAARYPELYDGAVGYSGCYLTDGPVGKALTDLIVLNGNGNAELMWGPQGGAAWTDHDLFANAHRLAGKKIYLSSGTGSAGPHETLDRPDLANLLVVGGALEAGSNMCTEQLAGALRDAGADVTRSAQPVGVHAWTYWRDEVARSWPTVEAALA
ncbi:esterase family protein [Rhodococcus sp. SGAir0479]|nr:esterase family protein [Rhodococcus sp. SGAir0479]